jgi:lipid-A-disaccharide synthase
MVNLIAEREITPELIQDNFQPAKVAQAIRQLLEPAASAKAREDLAEVRRRLGPPGAVERAAEAILAALAGQMKGSGNAS